MIPCKTIDFAIMTVARPQAYIHDFIGQLRADLPIRLVVGSPDSNYLKRYRENPFVEILEPPVSEWEYFRNFKVHHRAAWNYWRSLSLGIRSPNRHGLVVFEDDLVPAHCWEEQFYKIIDQIEMRHSTLYLLALYAPYDNLPEPIPETNFVLYPTDWFYGTQAIYYPEIVRLEFIKYLKSNGVDTHHHPYDRVLRDYLLEMKIPIFAAMPCLFQHVGEITTGLGGRFHSTSRFQTKP